MLKTRKDFELVQAYLATAIKIHRCVNKIEAGSPKGLIDVLNIPYRLALWQSDSENPSQVDELTTVLEELSLEEERVWSDYDQVMVQNAAVAQWVKNALL